MKGLKFFLTTLMAASLLSGCGERSVNITFHQDEGNQNDVFQYVIGKTTYKEVKAFQDEISINPRYGNDVTWEDFDLSEINEDYVVNAKYSLHDYVISYKYETRLIGTATYTIESTEVKEPELPSTAGYVYHYEDYSFKNKAEDFTVRAFRELAQYYATFVDIDGNPVCDPIPFTINTTEIEEPDVPVVPGKDGEWEPYVLDAADITIHPIYTTHYYYASFWTSNDETTRELIAKIPFVEGTTYIDEPSVPMSADYRDGHWSDYTLGTEDIDIYPIYGDLHVFKATFMNKNFSTMGIIEFTSETNNQPLLNPKPGYTATWRYDGHEYAGGEPMEGGLPMHDLNLFFVKEEGMSYTISLDPNGGTLSGPSQVSVVYGQPYELEVPSYYSQYNEFTGWYTSEGKEIKTSGTWNTIGNLTVTARYGLSFESGVVPSFISVKQNAELSITSTTYSFGKKSLKIAAPSNSTDFGVIFSKAYLDDTFSNPNVKAIIFDARGNEATSNFRARIAGSNITYENNDSNYGLDTQWKKFSFRRSYYEAYQEGDAMIFGRFASASKNVFIDNIIPSTEELDSYGLENGYLNTSTYTYMSAGHSNSDPAPATTFRLSPSGATVSNMTFDYNDKTEGNRAIRFDKSNGYLYFFLSTEIRNIMGNTGHVTFDLKTSIAINSNPSTKNLVDGTSAEKPFGGAGYQFPKDTWVSLTCYSRATDDPTNNITADGRFLCIRGSTACTVRIDNIRIYTN